jgi:Diguanylate cyclase, GGDEF domain
VADDGERDGSDDAGDGALEDDPSLLDPASGLFAEPFFRSVLSWRVGACRRVLRPVALVVVEVVDGLPDGPVVPSDPKVVATVIRSTLRSCDVAARLTDGAYGLLLEDTPEDGAVWAAERLRRALNTQPGGRALRAGVACYPGHALTPTDVLRAAKAAFAEAQEWPQDRVEVAAAAE